jgi:hypothetical protein
MDNTAVKTVNKDLLRACRAFVEQAEKVRGFPLAYEPYVGALVLARAAIRQYEDQEIYAKYATDSTDSLITVEFTAPVWGK